MRCAPGARRWAADVRRHSGRVFPQALSLALAARMAAPARCSRREIRIPTPLDRMGCRGAAALSNARWAACSCGRATVLALGGASWPRLGSDGGWVDNAGREGRGCLTARPANSGFTVAWSDVFRDRFEGQPLKGVALTVGAHSVRGEAVDHPQRHRGRRDLRAVSRIARGGAADRARQR